MKRRKQSRLKPPIEYRLLISQKYDERNKKPILSIVLRTTEEFRNFRYHISVDEKIENNIIYFNILGLYPPKILLPGGGPAIYTKELLNLQGTYTISISKHKEKQNTFIVNISDRAITIIKSPQDKFVEIVTKQEDL
ncbi:MAG TPA: hypothetical protein VFF29_02715 [Bacteroidota bacterium]|nr:hypothetical protein [Bacteroidota bacterium]